LQLLEKLWKRKKVRKKTQSKEDQNPSSVKKEDSQLKMEEKDHVDEPKVDENGMVIVPPISQPR
jgi:hypothetical protein